LSKQIEIHEHLGEDKGTYFIDSLNLTALQVQSDSYKFTTRIVAEGKDGLTFEDINNGKNYVENYQYSNKIKTIYWKDERYTVKESLLEDAKAKLEELSKPFTSYNASVLNLAELNLKYKSILDYSLGDTITLLSKSNKVKDKQRIVKTIEWPQDHTKDTVELANATLKFEDIQQENQETTDTVSNITVDNGTVDGSTIDSIQVKQIEDFKANVIEVVNLKAINASIENLHANKADIQDLHAVNAKIGTLEATKANITELNAVSAEIQQLNSIKANIVDLNSATAKIGVLEAKTASIDNLLSQKASINDLNALNATISEALIKKATIAQLEALETKTNNLIADKANIKDLNVANANVNKIQAETANIKTLLNGNLSSENIQAGGITSDKLTIANGFITNLMISSVSASKITAGTIDAAKINVVNLNADNLTVGKINGQLLKDGSISGLAIENGAIDNNKVSPNANIEASKINISSVVTAINEGSTLLTANKVTIDSEKGTLDVAFNNLNTSLEANKKITESNSTAINVVQGKLSASIENSKVLEGKQKTLEDNYNRTVVTVDSLKNTVGQQKTLIDSATGKITSVEVKANTLEKNLSGLTQTVTDTKKVIENNKTVLESKNAELKANIDSVSSSLSSVSSTVDKNNKTLVAKTNTLEQNLSGLSQTVANNKTVIDGKITSVEGETHELRAGLGGLTSKLDTLKSTTDGINKTVSNQGSVINQLKDSINLKVDSSTFTQSTQTINNNINRAKEEAINTANNNTSNIINNLDIGVENLLSDSNKIVGESSNGEFIQFADIAPIIDKYGLVKYTISFDIKSKDISKCDVVNCYCQNGSATKYSIGYNPIKVTRDFKRVHVTITPTLSNSNETKAMLAFYGNYGTGNIPIIKNVKIELGQFATTYSLSKEDLKKYSDDVAQAKADLAQANAIANADGKITEEERKRIQQAQENLNTAIARADKAKQDAINAASLDATNKANNALNNAKAYTNSEITTVNTHLNKATTEINLLKGEINLKVNQTDIDKTIKTIEDKIKSTTEKITTVESNLTQKTNSIEAGVRDLNSTTQTITTNISNLNRDLSNKINSNLSEAKSFATDIATNKANTAKQEAINNAKAYTNAEITTINSKVHNVESNLNILSDRINSKVSQSDVEKSIKEVVFNGRNLVRDSDLRNDLSFFNINNNSGHGSIEIVNFQGRKCLKFTNISEYRVSKYLSFIAKGFKINNNVSIGVDVYAIDGEGLCFDTSHNLGVEYINIDFTEKNKWIRLNKTSSKTTTKDGDINFALYGKGKTPVNCYITLFKVEEGNKSTGWTPAPEDESKVILDNIKVVDSKISDVSSSVTQLRDSVTTDIRAINSKTQSIETTLNGKASKQEVTEVNNRVATIKASLDSITQRVSSTESKTQTLESNINGKASKQEVNNVSSKVASVETSLNGITQRVSSTESNISKTNDRINSLASKEEVAQLKITTNSISTEVSKKVNGRDIISTINQSAESVKINASRINLQGYVTVGDLGSSNVTTINNAHVTSGVIEGRTMIALNGSGRENGILTVNNGESYLEYFRCREAWMMSPYANGWRVPLIHSKFGVKDSETASDMIDEISFYRGTDGRNYLQITNTKTGRVEYIELYRSAFDTVTILNRLDRIDAKLAGL
uniref:phage tail protein n=3 Tax=Clostridium perfringens TaxID=1502 RepID=UPI0039EB6B5B